LPVACLSEACVLAAGKANIRISAIH
jgi:hypothetical protein